MTNTQEAFEKTFMEKWGTKNKPERVRNTNPTVYWSDGFECAWQGWQANQAHNDSVIAELVEALEDTRKEMPHNSFNHDVNLYRRIDALIANHKKGL